MLANSDGSSPLRLETDAAQSKGLGMALWQQSSTGEWRLLRCASGHITDTEARYSATEIELLAVVLAAKKAHLFIAGADVELIVDHRPLISIINSKTLDELSTPRIVRLKEKLTPYRLNAMWRPGIEHIIKSGGLFSRHPVEVPGEDDLAREIEMEHTFHTLRMMRALDWDTSEYIIEDQRQKSLREECAKDDHYRNLVQVTTTGFPVKPDVYPGVRPYWSIRDELTVDDGIVLWGAGMTIPKSLRKEVLQQLHASHQGQERTLRRARQIVYWPNISNDIRNTVRTCAACAERLPSQPQEPLQQDDRPSRPFERVASDLCHVAGKTFLVLVDRYSGWPIVSDCGRSATARVVIRRMRWRMRLMTN